MSTYIIAPTGADIMHFGKGHDDNPPGRGSGRYPWGSGDSPRQPVDRGFITKRQRKKASKELQKYKEQMMTGSEKWNQFKEQINAINQAADKMNNGGIDEYNKMWDKYFGDNARKNHENDDLYDEVYDEMTGDLQSNVYNKNILEYYDSNKYSQQIRRLIEDYYLDEDNETAKQYVDTISELRNITKQKEKTTEDYVKEAYKKYQKISEKDRQKLVSLNKQVNNLNEKYDGSKKMDSDIDDLYVEMYDIYKKYRN